jgi:tetratricopeptide (TPR) repeat protein
LAKDEKTEARTHLLSEMKLASEDGHTLVSMGSMFLTLGDLGCATHCMLRAIDTDNADADAYYYLGVISALKEELDDAAELFAHALDIRDDHIPTLRDSALVCLDMGRLTEAAERIKKAQDLDAGDPQLKELGRKVSLARIKQRTMDLFRRPRLQSTLKNFTR